MKLHELVYKLDQAEHCPFLDKCTDGVYGNGEECYTQEYAICNQFYIFLEEYIKKIDKEKT